MEQNPVFMNSFGVMTSRVILTERSIGPYVLENDNTTGESYQNMLIHYKYPRF